MTVPETFEKIVRDHDSMLRRIASSYEARAHLAQDLVQDIYFAIWRALPAYRGEAGLDLCGPNRDEPRDYPRRPRAQGSAIHRS